VPPELLLPIQYIYLYDTMGRLSMDGNIDESECILDIFSFSEEVYIIVLSIKEEIKSVALVQ
jgi:hypothetical protein